MSLFYDSSVKPKDIISIAFIHPENLHATPDKYISQIHSDQLNIMSYHHNKVHNNTTSWIDTHKDMYFDKE